MLLSTLLLVSLTSAAAQSSSAPAAASASAAPNSTTPAANTTGDGAAIGTSLPGYGITYPNASAPLQVNFTRSYFTFPVDFIIDNNVYPPPPGSNSTIMLEQTVTLNLYAEGDAIPVTWAHVTPQGQIWCPEASSCSFGNDLLPSMRSPATNKDWPGLKYRALFNETFGGGSYVRGELGRLDPAALFGNATQKFYVQLVGDGKGQFENHTLNHNGPIYYATSQLFQVQNASAAHSQAYPNGPEFNGTGSEWAATPAKPSAAALVGVAPALVAAAVLVAVLV